MLLRRYTRMRAWLEVLSNMKRDLCKSSVSSNILLERSLYDPGLEKKASMHLSVATHEL